MLELASAERLLDKKTPSFLPEAFAEHGDHAIQKKSAVVAAGRWRAFSLACQSSSLIRPLDPKAYAEVIHEALENLEEETAEGRPVTGSDFWRSSATGAA